MTAAQAQGTIAPTTARGTYRVDAPDWMPADMVGSIHSRIWHHTQAGYPSRCSVRTDATMQDLTTARELWSLAESGGTVVLAPVGKGWDAVAAVHDAAAAQDRRPVSADDLQRAARQAVSAWEWTCQRTTRGTDRPVTGADMVAALRDGIDTESRRSYGGHGTAQRSQDAVAAWRRALPVVAQAMQYGDTDGRTPAQALQASDALRVADAVQAATVGRSNAGTLADMTAEQVAQAVSSHSYSFTDDMRANLHHGITLAVGRAHAERAAAQVQAVDVMASDTVRGYVADACAGHDVDGAAQDWTRATIAQVAATGAACTLQVVPSVGLPFPVVHVTTGDDAPKLAGLQAAGMVVVHRAHVACTATLTGDHGDGVGQVPPSGGDMLAVDANGDADTVRRVLRDHGMTCAPALGVYGGTVSDAMVAGLRGCTIDTVTSVHVSLRASLHGYGCAAVLTGDTVRPRA